MSRRDYISEILEKRERHPAVWKRWDMLLRRLTAVSELPSALADSVVMDWLPQMEFYRHIPVSLVACIEGYFRMVIADLIDHGTPFRENAGKFSNITFNLDTALALQKQSVSVGEFVAHLLPLSGLEDINRTLTTLLGQGYLEEWKRVRQDQPRQLSLFPEIEVNTDGRIFEAVSETFRLRHIFCHELAPRNWLDEARAPELTGFVIEFLWISELVVRKHLLHESELRRPRMPRSAQ